MKITGAIFDMDGTLLNSMQYFKPMGEKIMHRYNISNPDANDFYALSIQEMGEVLRLKYGVTDTLQQFVDFTNSLVEPAFFHEVLAKDYVEDFLIKLKENNVKMAVATLTDRYLAKAALERCGLLGYFCEIFCCGEVGVGKKSPKVYELAMEHIGTELSSTWVFEDSLYAAETAKKAGFKLAGVADEHSKKHENSIKAISDIFIDDYRKAYDDIIRL